MPRDEEPAPPGSQRRWRRWAVGLVVGLVVGVGTLVAGILGASLGLLAVVLLALRTGRDASVGGLLLGLGGSWTLLFLRGDLACGAGCIGPDLTGWYMVSAVLLAVGGVLTFRVARAGSG
jgi:hypothetical protein